MAIGKRKSKIVTFRLSAGEYEALSESCIAAGASSISEFARLAVLDRARFDAIAAELRRSYGWH